MKMDDGIKDRKFIVFESQLMTLFRRCHSCGLEVKLETSIVGTLLVVNGIQDFFQDFGQGELK